MAQIILKLSGEEKEKIKKAASLSYHSISAFMRIMALNRSDEIIALNNSKNKLIGDVNEKF